MRFKPMEIKTNHIQKLDKYCETENIYKSLVTISVKYFQR